MAKSTVMDFHRQVESKFDRYLMEHSNALVPPDKRISLNILLKLRSQVILHLLLNHEIIAEVGEPIDLSRQDLGLVVHVLG